MNPLGPVRWRLLGRALVVLGGPVLLLYEPGAVLGFLAALASAYAARAFWRRLEPIPPALAAPKRPLGLPLPGDTPPLRPSPERVGPVGAGRALVRSLGDPRVYARPAVVFGAGALALQTAAVLQDMKPFDDYSAPLYIGARLAFGIAVLLALSGAAAYGAGLWRDRKNRGNPVL